MIVALLGLIGWHLAVKLLSHYVVIHWHGYASFKELVPFSIEIYNLIILFLLKFPHTLGKKAHKQL